MFLPGLFIYLFSIGVISCYEYKTAYYEQYVDHFSFANTDTYQQKYLISDAYWERGFGPIFFYTGNEGDIEWFCNNTGFMWEIAPEFRALLVFAEHRFYGSSLPYGNKSYISPNYLGFLTSEQALADFAALLSYLKGTIQGAKDVPVIAFGGSYGGMLAAWFRIKYPHVVHGSLASSAPILQFQNLTSCDAFNKIVTHDFWLESAECSKSIRRSWDVFNIFNSTENGRKFLSDTFHLCSPIETDLDFITFKEWFSETYSSLAMMNYPYPTNFMMTLPGWPVKETCKFLRNSSLDNRKLMEQLYQAVSVYFNYTGTTDCLNVNVTSSASLGNAGWEFQACTEMIQPMCANGVIDMFEPDTWDYDAYAEECYNTYGVYPREMMGPLMYGGRNINASSNIIFSNGNLDPWYGGGVLQSMSPSLIAIFIDKSAHHLDLRASNKLDPISVIAAREKEKRYIKQWIDDYYGSPEWRLHSCNHVRCSV